MRGEREACLCRTTLFNGRLATSCDVRAGVWESFSTGSFRASGRSSGASRCDPLEVTETLFLSQQKEIEKKLGCLINNFGCGGETSVSMLFEESRERGAGFGQAQVLVLEVCRSCKGHAPFCAGPGASRAYARRTPGCCQRSDSPGRS